MKANIVDFLFEIATLKRLKRTGWQILGDNNESIAEHSFVTAIIAYSIATELAATVEKVLLMSLFHDVEETRTGDIYRLADDYVRAKKEKALQATLTHAPNAPMLTKLLEEYEKRKTLEAKIVKDADTLSLCLELKQLQEKGNIHVEEWLESNGSQLLLPLSKKLLKDIRQGDSQHWWQGFRKKHAPT